MGREKRISKIHFKNALGIAETILNPKQITQLSGRKASGKTSLIDSLRMVFKNQAPRTDFIRDNAEESLLYVELDDDTTTIDRRKRRVGSDYIKVPGHSAPQKYLNSLFSSEQFHPLLFLELDTKEQNKVLLSLVEDITTDEEIKEWFGQLPELGELEGAHTITILDFLQSKKSPWYLKREDINREWRYKEETALDYHSEIPDYFEADKWNDIDLANEYEAIEKIKQVNDNIMVAMETNTNLKTDLESVDNKFKVKKTELEELLEFKVSKIQKAIDQEVTQIDIKETEIEIEIEGLEEKIRKLTLKKNELGKDRKNLQTKEFDNRKKGIQDVHNKEIEYLDDDKKKEIETLTIKANEAKKYLLENREQDIEELKKNAFEVQEMKKLIPNYNKSIDYFDLVADLKKISDQYTSKIELCRTKPVEILAKSRMPISGMKLENGIVKILNTNNIYVPVDNLSDGEKLELCVDIAQAKCGVLKVILVDGFERLDASSQEIFIEKALKSGLQFFITKVSDTELTVTEYEDGVIVGDSC